MILELTTAAALSVLALLVYLVQRHVKIHHDAKHLPPGPPVNWLSGSPLPGP